MSRRGSRLACASHIAALLALPWVSAEHNRRGLVQFFTFGQFWNQDTLYADVQSLGPAALFVFDVADGSIRRERCWRPVAASRLAEAGDKASEQLDDTFKAAVDHRTARRSPAGRFIVRRA